MKWKEIKLYLTALPKTGLNILKVATYVLKDWPDVDWNQLPIVKAPACQETDLIMTRKPSEKLRLLKVICRAGVDQPFPTALFCATCGSF